MGGGFSRFIASLQPRQVQEIVDPIPTETGQRRDGVAISTSSTCSDCRVGVPSNIASSSVILSRASSGEYSATTKLFVQPSLPFKITWNGRSVDVTRMTLYHPFPLRIENVQPDAVLSLNDPSAADGSTFILIPLVASSLASPSVGFMDKLGPHIARVLAPDPTTKTIAPVTAAVGNDWMLTKVLPVSGTRVRDGFFQWFAGSGFESYVDTSVPFVRRTRWRARGARKNYIVMEKPVAISSTVLASILLLPRTDAFTAIDSVSPVVTYTPCAKTTVVTAPVREGFRDPECDPFGPNAYTDTSVDSSKRLAQIVTAIVSVMAIMVGVYIGLLLAGSQASIYTKQFGESAGEFLHNQIGRISSIKELVSGGIMKGIKGKIPRV